MSSRSGPRATLQSMERLELIPERRPDGTIVLRAAVQPPGRLRRILRSLFGRA